MPLCEYELYDPLTRTMTHCRAPGEIFFVPEKARRQGKSGKRSRVSLCPTHIAFVRDALMPIEAEYGKALALLKAEAGKGKRKPSPKVCPHCGLPL